MRPCCSQMARLRDADVEINALGHAAKIWLKRVARSSRHKSATTNFPTRTSSIQLLTTPAPSWASRPRSARGDGEVASPGAARGDDRGAQHMIQRTGQLRAGGAHKGAPHVSARCKSAGLSRREASRPAP